MARLARLHGVEAGLAEVTDRFNRAQAARLARLVRGILLKGNGTLESLTHVWPIALFLVCVISVGLRRYRQTLD
jgi:hypothetical protein